VAGRQRSLNERRIGLDGFDAYYEERGSGLPLILIHGLGGSTAMWQKVVDPLSERFRVISYDLRGLGRSETPTPPYSLAMLVGDLHDLAKSLALESFALVGHSLGGAIALAYAAEHPELVRALVGVAAPSSTPLEQRAHLEDRAASARRDGMGVIADLHVRNGLPETFQQAHAADVATYRSIIAASDSDGYAAHCGVIAALDLSDGLGRIRAPALLVQGELDGVVPAEAVRATAAAIAGCEYDELEGCGHVVPFERPSELTARVRELVDLTLVQ
jgi:3-oxoadipate enol-lactonase